MRSKLELLREENSRKIEAEIKKLDIVTYETVSELIPRLLAEGQLTLDHTAYVPADITSKFGVGRYLVYEHSDKDNPISIWTFAFASRQETCIHDHKYKGTVTVLNGPISEKYYKPLSDGPARLIKRTDRYSFHCNRDPLVDDGMFVHQLKRRKEFDPNEIGVTLHVYNMEARLTNPDGKEQDQRNLRTAYSKFKIFDKSIPGPAYEKEEYSAETTPSALK